MPHVHLRAKRRCVIAGVAGGLIALAVVLVAIIVYFSVASMPSDVTIQAGPPPTYGPTPTLAPSQQLTWKQLAVPALFNRSSSAVSLSLAPSDANTAYACLWTITNQSAAPEIWATHDDGASWRIVGQVPANPSGPCALAVDATQPNALVATVNQYIPHSTPLLPPNGQNFASRDGGTTWTNIGTREEFAQLATYKGLTYALADIYSRDNPFSWHLAVSSDLRHWHDIDQPIDQTSTQGTTDEVGQFWLNPTNGSILAASTNATPTNGSTQSFSSGGVPQRLWKSTDGGQTWTEITYQGFGAQTVAVQTPASGQPWHLCVTNWVIWIPLAAMKGNNLLACTSDGGNTWIPRPSLNVPWSDVEPPPPRGGLPPSKGSPVLMHGVAPLGILTIGADGSLIAAVNDTNAPLLNERWDIYRLPPNSSQWEPIGRAPDADGTFEAYPSGVILFGAGQDYTTTYS
ncbi:MAG: hypothetical protein ACLQUY_27790 [Ktedonobacterales bacterium]